MDARRVDDVCMRVRGLRFFQQLPRHLVSRFVAAMALRSVRAEALLHAAHGSPAARDEEHEFCVILRGSVAVYGDSSAAQQIGAGQGAAVLAPALEPAVPVHGLEGAPDDLDLPSVTLPPGVQPGSEAATAAAAAAAAAANIRKRGPRSLATASSGSISVPSAPWSAAGTAPAPGARLNAHTGSVSLANGVLSPLSGSIGRGEAPAAEPQAKQFSLVLNPSQAKSSPPPPMQRGISLVPDWVTPPTSDDESDSSNSSNNSDSDSDRKSAQGVAGKQEGENEESRRASALTATERARTAALVRRLESESAELEALAAEERSLLLAEDAYANRVLECVTTLREGDCFGLLSVLENIPRTATLVALDHTEMAVLTRSAYERIMRELNSEPARPLPHAAGAAAAPAPVPAPSLRPRCAIPSLAKYLRILRLPGEQRSDAHLSYLSSPLVPQSRMLQQLDPRSLLLFASGMKFLRVPRAGTVLQRQGEEAQWLYVVVQGSLSEHYKADAASSDDSHAGALDEEEQPFPSAFAAEDDNDSLAPASPRPVSRHGRHGSPSRRQGRGTSPTASSSPRRPGGAASASASASGAAGLSSAAAAASASAGSAPGDVLSSFGPCARLLLTGDASLFPGLDVLRPSFWSRSPSTLLSREPCVLAKVSVDYLAHALLALNRPMRGLAPLRNALQCPGERRSEAQIDAVDAMLKAVTMFQFKPPNLRRELCAKVQLVALGGEDDSGNVNDAAAAATPGAASASHVLFAQGEPGDAFYVLLSGSVSVHQLQAGGGGGASSGSASCAARALWDGSGPLGRRLPAFGLSVAKTFGPCLSVLRAGAHFGEQALISALPRSLSLITRGSPALLARVSRRDYDSVFVPVQSEMAFHASKALQLLSRPGPRTSATISALVDVLRHVPYFADMNVALRTFAARHMDHETVEADTLLFAEDDPADFLYVVMEGSVGVHILDKKQKELAKAAREEGRTPEEAQAEAARIAAADAQALTAAPSIAEQMADAAADEPPPPPTESELLAAQMARDAETEVARLRALKAESRNKRRARRQRHSGAPADRARHQRDVSGTSMSGVDDGEDSDSSSSGSSSADESTAGAKGLLATAAAGRLLASSRGDVFTASGAGQYALQQRLRSNSGVGSALGGGSADAVAELKKKEQSLAFRNKMQALQERAAKEAAPEAASAAGATAGTEGPGPDDSGESPLVASRALSTVGGSSSAPSASPTSRLVERVQVGHLSAAERAELYGPCVVQLPSGSVVGEVALTNATQRMRRTASIVTMEPTFFIKLRAEVVSRVTFGRGAGAAGAASGSGAPGSGPGSGPAAAMTQDSIAAFLKTLDLLQIVKGRGSATGAGTGSHATFKRLAYHMKDRHIAAGFRLQEQGGRSEHVYVVVHGSVRVGRMILVSGVRAAGGFVSAAAAAQATQALVGRDRVLIRDQVAGESFQRVDTTYLPEVTGPEAPAPPATTNAPATSAAPSPAGAAGSGAAAAAGSGGASGDPASSAAAAEREVAPGLPPLPQGLPLHVDLSVLGPGESIGGLEALRGEPHVNEFVVESASAVVLQMKRNHFLNLFPQRALEQLRIIGEQRAAVNARRVVKFVAMRCGHLNLNPIAAALQHMAGSAGALHRPQHEHSDSAEEFDDDGNEIKRKHKHRDRPVHQPSVPLPPALAGLTGVAAAQAAKDPLKRKGLHGLMQRPQTATSGAALMSASLSMAALAARKRREGSRDPHADEWSEMQAAEEHGLSPREAAAHAAAALLAPPPGTATGDDPDSSGAPRRREHVLAPPVVHRPTLQSAALMHAMALVEAKGAPPLTPVQRALGYTAEPRQPPPSFTWTTTPKGTPLAPPAPDSEAKNAPGAAATGGTPSRPHTAAIRLGSSVSTGALFSTPPFGSRTLPLRPSTSQGLRDAQMEMQMQSEPTSPKLGTAAAAAAVIGSSDSSRRTTGTRASADADVLSVLLSPPTCQGAAAGASRAVDPEAASERPVSPASAPSAPVPTTAAESPSADPAAPDADQAAAVEQRARSRREQSRGSMQLKASAGGPGLGPAVQYEYLSSGISPSALELRALSASLQEQRGGIIGLDGMPTLPTLQAMALAQQQADAEGSAHATARGSPSAPASRPVSARHRNKLAPLIVHAPGAGVGAGAAGLGVAETPPATASAALLQSDKQSQSPAVDSAAAAAAAAFFSNPGSSGPSTSTPTPTSAGTSGAPGVPVSSREILSMDPTSRAVVLMRAEKAQIKWESDEERRRGHRMLEKVRATSYNVPQDVKQAQLAVSLSWDAVDASLDPIKQSNAFIHSASPPLAVMNAALEGLHNSNAPGSPKRRPQRGPSISVSQLESPMATILDPALEAQTVQALLSRTAAMSEASYAATRAARLEGASRSFCAPRRRDDSNLAAASSGIIRTLLTPLVDPAFTSLFAVGAGSGMGSSQSTARTNRSEGAALFSITSGAGQLARSASASGKAFRPATAGELGRSASQRSLRDKSNSRQLVRGMVDRLSAPSGHSARPSSSAGAGGLSNREAEHKYPFVRFAAPVEAAVHDTLPHPDSGLSVAPVGSAPAAAGAGAWGYGTPARGAPPSMSMASHRVHSAGMHRSPSATAIVARIPQVKHVADGQSKGASAAAPAPTAASGLSAWQSDDADHSSHSEPFDTRAHLATPNMRAGASNRAAAAPSEQGQQQADPSSLSSPASAASPHSPLSPAMAGMRHTRTSSLGSFMALANAGVERRPSVSLLSPKSGQSPAGDFATGASLSLSGGIVEESAAEGENDNEQQQRREVGDEVEERGRDARITGRTEESKEQSEIAPRPSSAGPGGLSALALLSPSASAFSPPLGALSATSSAASLSRSAVGSAAASSSASSLAHADANSHSDAYLAGTVPAYRKTSFVDERLAALRSGARIVADAHQSVYSRSSLGGAQLPGARNALGGGADGVDLSRTEAEALRRKRLFGIAAPRVTGVAATDNPTAFAQVLATTASLPGKLLATKAQSKASKVRADEQRAAKAAKSDGLVGKILNDFKMVDDRNPL